MIKRRKFLRNVIGAASIAALSSCEQRKDDKIVIKENVSNFQIASTIFNEFPNAHSVLADVAYKTVDVNWMKSQFYDYFRSDLFSKGIVKWDKKFDCDKFAKYFAALIQVKYFVDNFQSWNPGESLAVGEIYYKVGGNDKKGHAINCVYLKNGFMFFEPQTGQFVDLSDVEKKSVFLVKI